MSPLSPSRKFFVTRAISVPKPVARTEACQGAELSAELGCAKPCHAEDLPVGLVCPDLMHSFFAEVAKGISRKLRDSGYNLVIAYSEEDPEVECQEIEGFLGVVWMGLIIASAQPPRHTRIFRRIEEEKVPYV